MATDIDLAGAFDLHVHCGPDVRPRKMTGGELARAAAGARMGGFLLKNHHTPTVLQASALQEAHPDLVIRGGLALNHAVGGFNPKAVEAALRMGAAVIWMPTLDAEHERAWRRQPGRGLTVFADDGRTLRPAVREILALVAEHDATLALGHLSEQEIGATLQAGRQARVSRFIVNHPEIAFMNLPIGFQRELAAPDVVLEHCLVRANSAVDWAGLAERIRATSAEHCALATDLGQLDNPDPVTGFATMLAELAALGFSHAELDLMARRNPRRILGLD